MVLGQPDLIEAELLRPLHLLELAVHDLVVAQPRHGLEEIKSPEAHGRGLSSHRIGSAPLAPITHATSGIPWPAMTEPVRIHLRVPGTAPMADLMRLIRSIEAAGFDGAGILDSQLLSRDTFVVLAGEIADGVLLLVGFNHGIVDKALEHLERGAKRSGRRVEDLEIIWAVRVGLASTTTEARRLARPTAVHWGVLRWGGHWVEPAGLCLPKLEIPDAVSKIYPDLSHAHDWEAAIAATSFVPDDVVAQLCDAIGLVGTPADCAARIVEMTKLGARKLYLMPLLTFGLPEQELVAFRDVVFPRLAAAGVRPAH